MKKPKYRLKKWVKVVLAFLLFIIVFSSIKQFRKAHTIIAYQKDGFFFDTYITLTIYDSIRNEEEANRILDNCIAKCQTYDNLFNRNFQGSEIYAINHANGEWTTVSDDTISLLYTALQYCAFSDGAIDITIAPVKDLWNFTQSEARVPDKFAVKQALAHVDYRRIEMNGNRVRLLDPEAEIDLGFVAKGYIADELKAYLLSEKVDNALINLGGNIQTIGCRPDGSAFRIGIQKPFAKTGEFLLAVDATEKETGYSTVVTSGIYERYFEKDDTIYHHILDTHTGFPVDNHLSSVTILTNSSVHADALSTTCFVVGLNKAIDLIKGMDGVDAIFITDQNEIFDTRSNE